jgi:hypothetical protein
VVRYLLCTAMLIMSVMTVAKAAEIEGFRLGMSMNEARQLATQRNYTFSNPIMGNTSDWVSYLLMNDGPGMSFCGSTVSSLHKSYKSHIHEFVSMLSQWTTSLGAPEVSSTQFYVQGTQHSSMEFRWPGDDNVRRTISLMQFGSNQVQISYGFAYIDHPCMKR